MLALMNTPGMTFTLWKLTLNLKESPTIVILILGTNLRLIDTLDAIISGKKLEISKISNTIPFYLNQLMMLMNQILFGQLIQKTI